ncbi:hypothetical protein GW17_00049604 [Ensete ventricosum]|nr:hypothetical protein GW17_00049604 [Ensete ventricosum]
MPRQWREAPHLHSPIRSNRRPLPAAIANLRGHQQDEEGLRDQVADEEGQPGAGEHLGEVLHQEASVGGRADEGADGDIGATGRTDSKGVAADCCRKSKSTIGGRLRGKKKREKKKRDKKKREEEGETYSSRAALPRFPHAIHRPRAILLLAGRRTRRQDLSAPLLSILAEEIEDLASKEKELFSPILKKWHPLAAGVAVTTLHSCYGTELKQFLSGVKELTPDVLQVLGAADKLEKDLLDIVVEDSVDSDDGGKSLIREMPPYEAESAIADLVRVWIKSRLDRLEEWLNRTLQQEPRQEARASHIVFFSLILPMKRQEAYGRRIEIGVQRRVSRFFLFFSLFFFLPRLILPEIGRQWSKSTITSRFRVVMGINSPSQRYHLVADSLCTGQQADRYVPPIPGGARNDFMPALPELTRCTVSSKLRKKKDKAHNSTKRRSQVGLTIADCSLGLSQFCVRINSLYHIRKMLENLEKKIKSCLRNLESAQADDVSNGTQSSFELSLAACQEGILQLCETTAYKMIFYDLDHVLWNSLYVGEAASSRIDPFLKELDLILEVVSNTVHMRVRHQLITELMKASFDGLLLVLLAGGPSRGFSCQDSQIIEEDFKSLRELYLADRDGLPEELFDKAATEMNKVLPLFRTDTETLVEKFKHMIAETYDPAAKSKYPIPPNPGNWCPKEPSTILHVLCHRNDVAATKFLKRTYNFPKKL